MIEYDRKKIVVSTVGLCQARESLNDFCNIMKFEPLSGIEGSGNCRWYETMIFKVKKVNGYWDANTQKQLSWEGTWNICAKSFDDLPKCSDILANDLHDKIVKKFSKKIKRM